VRRRGRDECRGKLGSLQFCVKKGVGWKAGMDLAIVRPVFRHSLDGCPASFASLWRPKKSWSRFLGLGHGRRSKTQHRCLAKAVTKIKYSRLKLRRRSQFDTLNMKKWFLVLGVVFTLGMLTPQSSNAGIFIGFPIPIPVFYGPHYYVGPGYYYPPGYYWGPYGYAYYPHPYWRHRYWRYHHWYYY